VQENVTGRIPVLFRDALGVMSADMGSILVRPFAVMRVEAVVGKLSYRTRWTRVNEIASAGQALFERPA
jgi:hypothetical protein